MSYFTKGSFIGNVDNYANTPVPETYSKKVMTQIGANANLFINSRDRNEGTILNLNIQPYNDFSITKGFPISQGQINSIIVSEVKFPTPYNITPLNNSLYLLTYDETGQVETFDSLTAGLTSGYYTGTQLATIFNTNVNTALPGSSCVYSGGRFIFTIDFSTQGGFNANWKIGFAPSLPTPLPFDVNDMYSHLSRLSVNDYGLMNTIGLNMSSGVNWIYGSGLTTLSSPQNVPTGIASLLQTDYIDITSDVLTQYQELTDTSTDKTNPAHIIARIYIADEISKATVDVSGNPVVPGTIYTTIHRQFKNPKIIRWNGQNSVDRIDLRLYDDRGRPLYVPPGSYPEFQLTIMPVEL